MRIYICIYYYIYLITMRQIYNINILKETIRKKEGKHEDTSTII